jgi:hypothetical protein
MYRSMHEKTKLQELAERARLYASVSSIMRNERDAEIFRDAADELEKRKTVLGTDAVSLTLEVAAGRYAVMDRAAREMAAAIRAISLPAQENE